MKFHDLKNRTAKPTGKSESLYTFRFILVCLFLILCAAGLLLRMVDLNVIQRKFLLKEGNARAIRVMKLPAYRGMVLDRNGVPLAISTPVKSIWVNPHLFKAKSWQWQHLAKYLHYSEAQLKQLIHENHKRYFFYLKRNLDPSLAAKIKALSIPGLFLQKDYKRFYPQGSSLAAIIGFTNVDDQGQSGLELAYNKWLRGISGKERVVRDRIGNVIARLGILRKPQPGHNLQLSIDYRIQYLAFHSLKQEVDHSKAKSGTIIVLNSQTGEILAMASYPSYNPNLLHKSDDPNYRNRTVTDVFEPGSTVKAFTVVNALDSGKYTPTTKVNTNPGWLRFGKDYIHDSGHVNNGILTVRGILQKSSNIGVTKLTLSLPPDSLWQVFHKVGFGRLSSIGFPGESPGVLIHHRIWRPVTLATLSYGYGLSTTTLQLAHAYMVLAEDGIWRPVSLLKLNHIPEGKRILHKHVCSEVLNMLESVVERGGTAPRASIPGYWVAGKTGTVRMVGPHGYELNHHIGTFVGVAPVTRPRLVVVVEIRDPRKGSYYGGLVAAPVFAKVMAGALRILNVAPDRPRKTGGPHA